MTDERLQRIQDLLRRTQARLQDMDTADPRYHSYYIFSVAIRDLLTDREDLLARIQELSQYVGNLRRQVPDDPDLGGPDD